MKMFLSKKWHNNCGFTVIEAIIVILIIGILASILMYRYNISQETEATVATDMLVADIQYTQAKAMASGIQQSIAFTNGSGSYALPGEQKKLPDGVFVISTSLPGNTLIFNTLGEPMFGNTDRTIVLTGGRALTIYAITGKVE